MKRFWPLMALCTGLALGGCATPEAGPMAPKTVDHVDLKRYQGKWFELARLPMYFQRDCAQSEAHYNLRADGSVGVLNRCLTLDGEWQEASGSATAQVPGKTDKLWVEFDNWFSRILPGVARVITGCCTSATTIRRPWWVILIASTCGCCRVRRPCRRWYAKACWPRRGSRAMTRRG